MHRHSANISSTLNDTPLWLALVDNLSVASPSALASSSIDSTESIAALTNRLSAQAIFSGWLHTCAIQTASSLGEQPELGAFVPHLCVLTAEAFWICAPVDEKYIRLPIRNVYIEVTINNTDSNTTITTTTSTTNTTTTNTTSGAGAMPNNNNNNITDFSIFSPQGTFVFRASTPSEASAWLMHVNAATVRLRSGDTTAAMPVAAVAAYPLLFGDGTLLSVAESVCANASRISTNALLFDGANAAALDSSSVCAILSQYSARQQLRAFCRRLLPEHIALLNAYEHVLAIKLLWAQYEKGDIAVSGIALTAHALATYRRFFNMNSRAPVQLTNAVDTALTQAIQAARGGPAATSAALLFTIPTLILFIRERVLLPFARARASRFTAYTTTEVRAQRVSAAAVLVRPTAKSFFSARRLSRSESFNAGTTSSESGKEGKARGLSRGLSISEWKGADDAPLVKSPSNRRFTLFPLVKAVVAEVVDELKRSGVNSPEKIIEDDSFFDFIDGEDGPAHSLISPMLIGRIDATAIPSTAVSAPLDPLLFEPAGAQSYPNHDAESVAALLPALLAVGEQGRVAWALSRRDLSRKVRLPTLALCDPAEFARSMRDEGVTPNKLRLVIKGDIVYTAELWDDASQTNSTALLYAVRDAVTSGILLTAEMRQGGNGVGGVMSNATTLLQVEVTKEAATKTGLSEKAFKSVFGVARVAHQQAPSACKKDNVVVDVTPLWNLNAESLRLTKDHPAYDMIMTTANANASDFFACPAQAMKRCDASTLTPAVPSLSLSLRKFDNTLLDSSVSNAIHPLPVSHSIQAYAYWCPGVAQSAIAVEIVGSVLVTMSQLQSQSPSAVPPVHIKTLCSLNVPAGSWSKVNANLHADGVLTLRDEPASDSDVDPLFPTYRAFLQKPYRAGPNRALFHVSSALAIVPTRFIWAGRHAIDIILSNGVLTLFASAGTSATKGLQFLKVLNEAAARKAVSSVHAVTIPSNVTGGERVRLQITSVIESSRSSDSILSGTLHKRGAIRAAFRLREFKLHYRDEKSSSWIPSLLRNDTPDHLSTSQIVLSYYKQGKSRGEICIRNANIEGMIRELRLVKSPSADTSAAPISAIAKVFFGEGSSDSDYEFKIVTDQRTWTFATRSCSDASSWLAALSIGLRSRDATLLANLHIE